MLHDPKREAQIAEEIFHASLEPWQRLLLQAVDEIRARGWVAGAYVSVGFKNGSVCIMGALRFADHWLVDEVKGMHHIKKRGSRAYMAATRNLGDYLKPVVIKYREWLIGDTPQSYVETYNDGHIDTTEDVIRVLHTVALG